MTGHEAAVVEINHGRRLLATIAENFASGSGRKETPPEAPQGKATSPGASFLPDPGYLWLIFRRRLWVFVAVAAIVLALVAAYTLTRPVLYSATATVLIEPRQPAVLETELVSPSIVPETNVIDTEVEVLASPRLAGRVAEALRLADRPEFQATMANASYDPLDQGTHPLASTVLSRVDIRRSGLTYLISITATAEDPDLAAELANEFVRQYLAQQQDMKEANTRQAEGFLQTRLVQLRRQAADADAALQGYKIRNNLMSAEGATMAEQEVSVLNQEISVARAALAEKMGQLGAAQRQVQRGGTGAEVSAALQSSTVAELRGREAELTGQLASLNERFGPRHPEVLRAEQQLADTRSQVQREINRVLVSISSDAEAARSRLASLEASQARAQNALESNNAAQVGYLDLERNAEAARAIYETFLQRAGDVASQEGLIRPDASIEALARVPSQPSSPDYPLSILLGLTAAAIGGFIGVGTAEYLDARIRTRSDVEGRLRLPYAGAVPDLQSTMRAAGGGGVAPYDYLLEHPQSKYDEAFRALKSSLMLGRSSSPRSIAITSALPREGKSTTALCLARIMAQSGVSTVLVDCDARRRAASDALLPEDWDGFTRYLYEGATLEEALFQDQRTNLQILGSRTPETTGREMFADVPLRRLLTELEGRFDLVILDTAPVLGIAETRAVAAEVDSVLMLARWRSTSIKAVDTAADLLLSAKANISGLALTLVDVRRYASTGQQDVYSYQDKFAGYYVD